jgi:glyoxylase-like metal-dependent hydrolase (beta-lactamase superfamily II)
LNDTYELFAVRYGHNDRRAAANFIGGDPHNGPMPLDYFVWVIRGAARTFLFDTGFDAKSGQRRDRQLTRPVGVGLKMVGVDPDTVEDVIISHMHFDHAGNAELFPRARYHLQDTEMAYCTGRCMCHHGLRHPFDLADVTAMLAKVYAERVIFHDGASEIAPNLTVHKVGGHSKGLQIVRVLTRRGWVVLGSDASHFYANFEQGRPFPVLESVTDMLEGFNTMRRLASSPNHIIPGHDPLVIDRYPAVLPGVDDIVRLDADPADA